MIDGIYTYDCVQLNKKLGKFEEETRQEKMEKQALIKKYDESLKVCMYVCRSGRRGCSLSMILIHSIH